MALRNRKLGTIEALQGQILQETDAGAVVDNIRVYEGGSGAKYEDISSQTYKTSIERIRAASNLNPNIIYITPDGGNWVIDPDDETTPDNTGTVLVAADGLRLKRVIDTEVLSDWFNPNRDGLTDDTDILKAAISAAKASGVNRLKIGPGQYMLNTITEYDTGKYKGVFLLPSDIEIEGDGAIFVGDKSITSAPQGYAIFIIGGNSAPGTVENVTIRGIVFDGIDARTQYGLAAPVVLRPTCKNITLDSLTVKNVVGSALFSQTDLGLGLILCDGLRITNCTIDQADGHGIGLRGCHNVVITGNTITGCYTEAYVGLAIDVSRGCKNVVVSNNIASDCAGGFKFESVTADNEASYAVAFTNNIFEGSSNTTSYGIRISADYSIVKGNIFRNCGDKAISMVSEQNRRAIIADNIFENTAGKIADIICYYDEPTVIHKDLLIISGNTFEGATGPLSLRSSGVTVANNTFKDISGFSVRIHNDLSPDGETTFDDISITGNKFYSSGGTQIDELSGSQSKNIDFSHNRIVGQPSGNGLNAVGVSGIIVNANQISADGIDGIKLTRCNDFSILGNIISSADEAIVVSSCDQGVITGNVTIGGNYCISQVGGAVNNVIIKNNIDNGSVNGSTYHVSVYDGQPHYLLMTGTALNFRLYNFFEKDINDDITLAVSISNIIPYQQVYLQINNTDTDSHRVTITGITLPNGGNSIVVPAEASVRVAMISIGGKLKAVASTYYNSAGVNLTGTTVDASTGLYFYADISNNTTLVLANFYDGDKRSVQLRNTDTNPHTVTITGVPFPDGANNEIPAGGRAHISLHQINGVIDTAISIYSV